MFDQCFSPSRFYTYDMWVGSELNILIIFAHNQILYMRPRFKFLQLHLPRGYVAELRYRHPRHARWMSWWTVTSIHKNRGTVKF